MANDPGWGNRNNDGPPDLDEVFRQFSRKLNGLFGKNGGPGALSQSPRQSQYCLFWAWWPSSGLPRVSIQ